MATRTALIVPLRSGGGTRLKILEGLSFGVPTVSTSIGAEGLDLVPGEHLMIGDDPRAFAAAVLRHPRAIAALRARSASGRRSSSSTTTGARRAPACRSSCSRHAPSRAPAGRHDLQDPASAPMTRTSRSPGGSPVVLAVAGVAGGAVRAALLGAAVPPALVNGYLAVVTVASRAGRRQTDGAVAAAGHRVAVLIPAHDEEAVIGDTLAALVAADTPRAAHRPCRGRPLHRPHGGAVAAVGVDVRENTSARGKGPALEWLLGRVLDEADAAGQPIDAVVVIDADTVVTPGFLGARSPGVSSRVPSWCRVSTGCATPVPVDSHGAAQRGVGAAPPPPPARADRARRVLGLFGNGMAFTTDVLRAWRGATT